jgi:predicted alpha/beta hydrolase
MNDVQTLTVTTADQHRFNATLYPTAEPDAPVLLFMSALGTPAKVYRHLGKEMVQHGIQVCTPDWRGIDSSSIRAGRSHDFGYRHLLELDIPALIAAIQQRLPLAPIWLGGHSLGGQMALAQCGRQSGPVSGVVMIASGSVHLPCYPGQIALGRARSGDVVFPDGTGAWLLSRRQSGVWWSRSCGLMRDWSHVARTGEYRPAGSQLDYEQLLQTLDMPVLAITFVADKWAPAVGHTGIAAQSCEAKASTLALVRVGNRRSRGRSLLLDQTPGPGRAGRIEIHPGVRGALMAA